VNWIDRAAQIISRTASWVSSKLAGLCPRGKTSAYRCARVDELPDRLANRTLYLAGEEGHIWAAAMSCPCGCGERIELNLLAQVRPSWTAEPHADGSVTLAPSVWRQKGCRSHFWVRRGRIVWCRDVDLQINERP
jgi:hypothetical protein